jgi:hypothetical protein
MKEEEIRPKKIFDEYLRLAEADTQKYFADVQRVRCACPACRNHGEFAFRKHGFDYDTCAFCQTLFVNPRPVPEAFSRYYTESDSSKFWATTFYKETADARREKLWKPKARMVIDALSRYSATGHTVIDIGGGFGLFALEMHAQSGRAVTVIEPSPHLADACREKGLLVVQKFLEDVIDSDLPRGGRAFASFELFEHLHNPENFLRGVLSLMSSGDVFLMTTLSGAGVDIQALWEDSKSVSPPHHLNFLNPSSLGVLMRRLGFDLLEVTTPGKLDLDILVNNQKFIKDRFWKTFVASANEDQRAKWQAHISASGWSSHMMAVCRKP